MALRFCFIHFCFFSLRHDFCCFTTSNEVYFIGIYVLPNALNVKARHYARMGKGSEESRLGVCPQCFRLNWGREGERKHGLKERMEPQNSVDIKECGPGARRVEPINCEILNKLIPLCSSFLIREGRERE